MTKFITVTFNTIHVYDLLVTISLQIIKEKSYEYFLRCFEECNGEQSIFWQRLPAKPKRQVNYVYFVIGGKIRYRGKLLEFRGPQHINLTDGRTLFGKAWALVIDFERLPRPWTTKKGFQGFRYIEVQNDY